MATTGSLFIAFFVSALWFSKTTGNARFEPAVESLGLLAGITGVIAERRAANRERREQILHAMREELKANYNILHSPPFTKTAGQLLRRQVYRRVHLSAVDAAFTSGALSPRRDESLVTLLHDWRDEVGMFNHQLALAEILAFTDGSDEVLRDLHEGLHRAAGPLTDIRHKLTILIDAMPSRSS